MKLFQNLKNIVNIITHQNLAERRTIMPNKKKKSLYHKLYVEDMRNQRMPIEISQNPSYQEILSVHVKVNKQKSKPFRTKMSTVKKQIKPISTLPEYLKGKVSQEVFDSTFTSILEWAKQFTSSSQIYDHTCLVKSALLCLPSEVSVLDYKPCGITVVFKLDLEDIFSSGLLEEDEIEWLEKSKNTCISENTRIIVILFASGKRRWNIYHQDELHMMMEALRQADTF